MSINIPSTEDVREALRTLTMRQLDRLAEVSGVNAKTLRNIRYGASSEPGLDKVAAFWPHIESVRTDPQRAA